MRGNQGLDVPLREVLTVPNGERLSALRMFTYPRILIKGRRRSMSDCTASSNRTLHSQYIRHARDIEALTVSGTSGQFRHIESVVYHAQSPKIALYCTYFACVGSLTS